MSEAFRPDIVATPLADGAVQVVIDGPGTRWSYIADVPRSAREPVGPHPLALALGGWAACTVMTSVGVAYRGNVPLDDIDVTLQVEATDGADRPGFGVREFVALAGDFSDAHLARLRRAVGYCPVSQMFTKGALVVADDVVADDVVARPRADTATIAAAIPAADISWNIAPTVVKGQYLSDTKEYRDDRLSDEGEVKLYVSSDNPAATGRWMLLCGHTSTPWMPHPVPLALAGLAASTASTVSSLFAAGSAPSFQVELAATPSLGRDLAQTSAANATVNSRRLVRRVVVTDAVSAALQSDIRAAMSRDPLHQLFQRGNALLSADITVVS